MAKEELFKNEIEIIDVDCPFGISIRIFVKINGMLFKRIWDRSGRYPAVWHDEEYNIGDTMAIQDAEKEKQLESIFKAFCLQTKFEAETWRIENKK